MKALSTLLLLTTLGLTCTAQDNEWQLTWSEEFNYSGFPNPAYWEYREGKSYNNELQYYTRERAANLFVQDSVLVITAIKEDFDTMHYTSGRISTRGKLNFQYGKLEIRAKLPKGRGIWPAIWMLGNRFSEVGWPTCGEIDIMEYVGFDRYNVHGYVHTGAYNHLKATQKGNRLKIGRPEENFHIYAIEWLEDRIDFFVDGTKFFTFENERKTYAEWPFDDPHFLILNVAVGGDWGGMRGIDDKIFPQQMMIDYVRYYEKAK